MTTDLRLRVAAVLKAPEMLGPALRGPRGSHEFRTWRVHRTIGAERDECGDGHAHSRNGPTHGGRARLERATALPPDLAVRRHRRLPHGGAGRSRWLDRLVLHAALR